MLILKSKKPFQEEEFEKVFPAGVAFDSRSRSLVTNGWPGHVQFFSLDQSQLSFNVSIIFFYNNGL